jgi:hypothetical protein
MTDLKDREMALENFFSHGQEIESRVKAKALRSFGLWAAMKLGLSGESAEEYAYTLVVYKYDHLKQNGKNATDKVISDFEKRDIEVSRYEVLDHYEKSLVEARAEIMGDK